MPLSAIGAVTLAVAAAVADGASSVFEQRSTKQVPQRRALSPMLLVDLFRRRMWLAAVSLNVVGLVLQVLALRFGALALVQPLIASNLLFAVLIAAFTLRRRPPDRVMLTGVVACSGGIAWFLVVARPRGGREIVSPVTLLPLAIGLAAVLAACLAVAGLATRRGSAQARSLALALACGVDFGVNAFLLKLVSHTLPEGFGDPSRQWPLYAVVVVGPLGFLLNQDAFQAGALISPVLAIITVADPLVSIALASIFLDESIAHTPLDLSGEAAGLALMTGGIYALAHRAPQVAAAEPRLSVRIGASAWKWRPNSAA